MCNLNNNIINNNMNIGKDCENIILEYIDELIEDEDGNDIEVGVCGYCMEEDCLYIQSEEEKKNMCFICWEVVKDGKGWSLVDKEDLEEVEVYEFMNDLDYYYIDNYGKWYNCNEVSFCNGCETDRMIEMVKTCYKCEENYCCDIEYIEIVGENVCNDCVEESIVDISEDCKVNCSGCNENVWELSDKYDMVIYEIVDNYICGDCL